jgi:hypothetical protein
MSIDNFNTFYKKSLNEGMLSNFASGFQQGMKDARDGKLPQNPFRKEDQKTTKDNRVGLKNPPKKGEIIVLKLKDNINLKAKVATKIDKNGQWEIEILNQNTQPEPFYYYISDLYPNGVITTPSFIKSKHKTPDQINSVEGPYIDCVVGFNTPYPTWYSEKDLLKSY